MGEEMLTLPQESHEEGANIHVVTNKNLSLH